MKIADELVLLANTKESLRVAIGLSTTIPFSQYAVNVPWAGDVIPATGTVFDFQKNRYAKDGKAAYLDDASEFIRLSSATKWQDEQLVDVPENTPRINSDGLLIEPQRTNLFPNSVMTTGVGVIPTTLEVSEGNVVPAVRFPQKTTTYSYVSVLRPNPCVISAYVKNSDNSKPEFVGIGSGLEADFSLVLVGNALPTVNYTVSRHGDVYRVSGLSEQPEAQGNTGIVKYTGNSAKDVTATYRQIEAGNTLTSLIKSSGTPATRAPDILNIPLLPEQTITGDWDAGVTYSLVGGIATFTGHGYIRNITVEAL